MLQSHSNTSMLLERMTLLLGKDDKLLYYFGVGDKSPQMEKTDYSPEGLRAVVLKRIAFAKAYGGLFVIIKPNEDARYKNIVDVFDEMNNGQRELYCKTIN